MEPPPVQENHPAVENGKVSSNGASTEKEDNKSDKTAPAAEQTVEPEATGSDSKFPADSPAKKAKDGHSDEADKKQSGTNDDSPRATDSLRYRFLGLCSHFSAPLSVLVTKNHKFESQVMLFRTVYLRLLCAEICLPFI